MGRCGEVDGSLGRDEVAELTDLTELLFVGATALETDEQDPERCLSTLRGLPAFEEPEPGWGWLIGLFDSSAAMSSGENSGE